MKLTSLAIGILGVSLFACSFLSTPHSGALGITAGLLGVIAAITGNKWWFALPGTILGATAIMYLILRHAD